MARSLGPIPIAVPIVESDGEFAGTITQFFRERWEELRNGFTLTPFVGELSRSPLNAALPTTAVYTALAGGRYRVTYYIRKTTADGVSSSLQVTLGWTENGLPLSETFTAIAVDATNAQQNGSKLVVADANSDLTIAVAYASGTPGTMAYRLEAVVEQL